MPSGSLEKRILSGTTTERDAVDYRILRAIAFRNLAPLIAVLVGGLLVGLAIGGLFF